MRFLAVILIALMLPLSTSVPSAMACPTTACGANCPKNAPVHPPSCCRAPAVLDRATNQVRGADHFDSIASLPATVAITTISHLRNTVITRGYSPPDLLLGGLLELAPPLPDLPATRRTAIALAGRAKLDARATSKRAWKSWSRSKELHSLTLSSEHIRRIIGALNGDEPCNSVELPRMMLRLLGGETSDD